MPRLVLSNANLLDGRAPAAPGSTIYVDGEVIAAVHPGLQPSDPEPGDRIVDLAGRTVMAGMTTCHFHSTYHDLGSRSVPYGYDHPPAYQALIAARNLETALRCGYTSAVSAGATFNIDPAMATAIDDGFIAGPRFLPGSHELSTTGHANDVVPWYWEHPATAAMRICDGADQFRKAVREEVRNGARVIKLFVTGGHGVRAPKHRTELTRDELAAAIETAHERDVLVRGHITNKPAILAAIELGIDIVDHCDDLDEEIIAAAVEHGTFIVPSIRLQEVMIDLLGGRAADAIRSDVERMYEMLPVADAAGVRILVGDDYGAFGLPHGAYGDELTSYVRHAGIAPLDVLRWATRNGAALTGEESGRGTVQAGRLADLVVLDGDPSDDITVLADPKRIVAVLKDGHVVSGAL